MYPGNKRKAGLAPGPSLPFHRGNNALHTRTLRIPAENSTLSRKDKGMSPIDFRF
jgi:hypothetical protein